ncbi:MAG TPA: hypothetical protein VIM03_10295, partial [Thermoleophilaceae bacterium]
MAELRARHVPGITRYRASFLRQGCTLVEAPVDHQVLCQGSQRPGAQPARFVRHHGEGVFHCLDATDEVTARPQVAPELHVHRPELAPQLVVAHSRFTTGTATDPLLEGAAHERRGSSERAGGRCG